MSSQTPQSIGPGVGSYITVSKSKQDEQVPKTDEIEPATQNHVEDGSKETFVDTQAADNDSSEQVDEDGPEQSEPRDLFMLLPPELRNRIYGLCLTGDSFPIRQNRHERWHSKTPKWREPGLLKVSKFIRHEASGIFYAGNVFDLWLNTSHFPVACNWLASIARRCGPQPFRFFQFVVCYPRWDDLEHLTSVARLYFETPIELMFPGPSDSLGCNHTVRTKPWHEIWPAGPCPTRHPSCDSIFEMQSYNKPLYWQELENIAALGRRAREQKWSRIRFELELDMWRAEVEDKPHVLSSRVQKAKRVKKANEKAVMEAKRTHEHAKMLGTTRPW
jgi:hypothetical protein